MTINLPPQPSEAKQLFEEFERSVDHKRKTKSFDEAANIIDKYLLNNPDSPYIEFATNLKLTYTRKLLEQISENSKFHERNEYCLYYLYIMMGICKNEVEMLTKESPSLKKSCDVFIEMWGEDLITNIKRIIRDIGRRKI